MGRLLRLTALLALVLVAGLALAWFAMRDQIIDKVLDLAEARLASHGLHIARGSHELTWRRGVVLKDLQVYADEGKQERVAVFENVGARIPLWELFNEHAKLVLTSETGDLKLETSAGPLVLEDLDFKLDFSVLGLESGRLEGVLKGLRVTCDGSLRWEKRKGVQEVEIPDFSPLVRASKWIDFPKDKVTLAVRIQSRNAGGVDLKGDFSGTGFRWRKLSIDRAKVPIALVENGVEMSGVSIDCYGGTVSGDLVLDYKKMELRISKVVSSIKPFRLVGALMGGGGGKSFHTVGKTVLSGNDISVDLKDFARTKGVLQADSPAGLIIPFDSKEVVLKDFHGTLRFADGKLVVDGEKFSVYDGMASGSCTMPLSGGFHYRLKLDAKAVSLAKAGAVFGVHKDLIGTMDASFDGGGAKALSSHFGSGRVEVRNGRFYAVPLFGSLRAALTEESPEFGRDVARSLNTGYSLKDGLLRSSDLRIENAATVVLVKGELDLAHRTIDADVRANLKGIPGVATELVSRILELHGEGALDDVKWRLAHVQDIPKVVEKVPKVVEKVPKAAAHVLEDVLKGVDHTAGEAVKDLEGRRKTPEGKK